MPAPANLGFETAGASPGLAASWTASFVATYEEIASFGTATAPWEDFEDQWNNAPYLFEFTDPDVQRALFVDPVPPAVRNAEDFEVLWSSNEGFQTELTNTEAAEFDGEGLEDFEDAWANDLYLTAFDVFDLDDTLGAETFETVWANVPYLTSFTNPDLSAAAFDGDTPEAFEDFNEVFPLREYTVNVTSNVFTSPAHGFVLDQPVTLAGDGARPAPLQDLVTYYARTITTDTLQLAASPGGAAIDITSEGGGERFLQADEARYWTLQMTTL